MNLPRVDVVIASNRGGPFLDEAIDTALDQEGVSVRLILSGRCSSGARPVVP
ncbi:MAG: hypothetical protein IPI13_01450 [Actinomycetales bacterium]|uniref:Uncharacterized protein n=1 Tax=Candidatus Phosphoribacter hodrii TaxID=2953743 RepID=A0A935IIL8_9MICO|nr:hypothetical protein [Candidatus Phosphoribacter hodrii]